MQKGYPSPSYFLPLPVGGGGNAVDSPLSKGGKEIR